MRALVTGGGGFLGLYIVEQLRARGDDVRAFCRGDYPRLKTLGVEIHRGDIRDRAAVAAACEGIDCVFHTAAVPGIWGPWRLFHETNAMGTENVLHGCRTHRVERLVFTSSPSVVFGGGDHAGGDESLPYPDRWLAHYPRSKALAEQAVLAEGREGKTAAVAIRPHLIWGPRDNHLIPRLIRRAKSGRLRRVGGGANQISMAYVENVAAAHLQAADRLLQDRSISGRAYFINEKEPVPLWGWIDRLLSLAGLPPIRKSLSVGAANVVGRACEGLWSLLRLPGEPPMTRFLAAQLAGTHWYRIERAERDFGYSPMVSVEEGLAKLEPELRLLAR